MRANSMMLETISTDSRFRSIALVLLSSILIGLFANVAIPLPFTPIPLATQGLVVLILSVLLGSKKAFGAVLGFLAQGALGLPVFAGGLGGIERLIGPTGGYLFGYLAAAVVVGYLAERMTKPTPLQLFGVLGVGNALFFLFGVPYLSLFLGMKSAFLLGFLPFILGDLLKIGFGVKILLSVKNFLVR
jgi:biotin transport system substrate-specific component